MKIKVISLNIWHGGRIWDNALAFIRAEDPDILMMQEVFNEHDPTLEKRFRTVEEYMGTFEFADYEFAPSCKFVSPEGDFECGNAIFSKLPILKRYDPFFFNNPYSEHYEDVPGNYQNEPRNLAHIVVDAGGTPLDVITLQGTWDLDGERDSPDRLKMSQAMLSAAQRGRYVVMGGDTNARPNTQTIRNVEQQLTNVFKDELSTTFNLSRKDLDLFPGYSDSVVDMLFVSPEVKVHTKSCPQVDVSDHLPLMIEIEI